MTDLFAATDSGILVPTRLRGQVIPWQALNALNPPVDQPHVSTDLLSTLAVLIAQGPRAPAALGADEHSSLLVNAEINQHTTVGRPQSVGDHVLMVTDPTFGGAGDVFLVIPASGSPAHGPYQVSGQGQDSDGTIHLLFGLQANTAVGDGARRLPLVGISSALNGVIVNNSSTNPVSVSSATSPPPFDLQQSFIGSGTLTNPFGGALLKLGAVFVAAWQGSPTGAVYSPTVTFTDAIGGQFMWEVAVSVPAVAGQWAGIAQSGLVAQATGVGDGITVTVVPAPGANQNVLITIGVYAH